MADAVIQRVFWHGIQVARAVSRLLNALMGGEGDTTFSAYSWHLKQKGKRIGLVRVVLVDRLFGSGHCEDACEWHRERRLFEDDLK